MIVENFVKIPKNCGELVAAAAAMQLIVRLYEVEIAMPQFHWNLNANIQWLKIL